VRVVAWARVSVWTSERVGVGKSFPNVEQAVKYVSIPTIGAESVKKHYLRATTAAADLKADSTYNLFFQCLWQK
jgi:hypothetical protein